MAVVVVVASEVSAVSVGGEEDEDSDDVDVDVSEADVDELTDDAVVDNDPARKGRQSGTLKTTFKPVWNSQTSLEQSNQSGTSIQTSLEH